MAAPEQEIPEADAPNTRDPDQAHNDQHMDEEPEENNDATVENPHMEEETVESTGVEEDQDMTSDTNAVETPGVGNDPTEPDTGTESKTVGGYSLQWNRAHTYSHLKTQASSQEWGEMHATISTTGEVNQSTAQVPMKTRLHLFRDAGDQAVKSEMGQLHKCVVMKPKHSKDLMTEQWREALAYLMFLKQKRCGMIKARGCADGCKQREKIMKQESASPTVATKSVFLTAVVDAHEGGTVKIVDVRGAFMHADQDDLVHVQFTGEMVDKMIKIEEEMYASYVIWEGRQKVMDVELLKALYGTIKAAKLFWEKMTNHLVKDWGFTINPYDSCVVNKMINGKQWSIVWHVDDLKISHVSEEVVDNVIDLMNHVFGDQTPMTVSGGACRLSWHDFRFYYTRETPGAYEGIY